VLFSAVVSGSITLGAGEGVTGVSVMPTLGSGARSDGWASADGLLFAGVIE
jgi:hypothetical protein